MKKLIAVLLLAFTVGMGFAQKASYRNKDYDRLDEQEKYQEIITDITKKDESEFTASDYFYLGLANFRLENDDLAIKYFNTVIQIDPEFSSPYYYIAGIYYFTGKYEKAIPYYKKCVELDDKDSQAYQWLGFIYEELGNYQEALDCFTKFYALDKKNPEASYQMAYILYLTNDLEKAKPYAEAYLKHDKNSYTMNSIMILNLYSKGDYKKAKKYEDQLIKIWKNSQDELIKELSYFTIYNFSYNGYDLSVFKRFDQTGNFYDLLVCSVYSDDELIKTVTLEYDSLMGDELYFIGTYDVETSIHSTSTIVYSKCPDFSEFIKCIKLALDGKLEISASSTRK